MRLVGHPDDLLILIMKDNPNVADALLVSSNIKAQLEPYQAAALLTLAAKYDGGDILEIGTFVGYSASLMAQAAPNATITTLNPAVHEAMVARQSLFPYPNVTVIEQKSWDYLRTYAGPHLDMIFVDGDHKRVEKDLPWWSWLNSGGLMLFHDYTPHSSPHVCHAVDSMSELLRKEPDVLLVDTNDVGMAGFIK